MLGAMAKVASKPSALIDTRVIYCGDNLEQLRKLPNACVDLIYIDPPFNSNRNYEVFWGETKEKRAFADRHASTQATSSSCARAVSSCIASSRKPAAFITTATGTLATTSRSCSIRFLTKTILKTRSPGKEQLHTPIRTASDMFTISSSVIRMAENQYSTCS